MLGIFSTVELLQLALVSRRFHSLVSRLLHRRLLDVASLPANDLILECYHPSAKISTPYLSCRHIGTKMKSCDDSGVKLEELEVEPKLESLSRMYSTFRPVVAEENRRRRLRIAESSQRNDDDDVATELVHLDDGELFVQLCAVTNVVKSGPKPGLFLSHVNISDGVIRVWRDWLAEMAQTQGELAKPTDGKRILWVNAGQTIGLRFKVSPGPIDRMPVISGPEDHPPVSYHLQYEGLSTFLEETLKGICTNHFLEELFVRTASLLLAAEKSAIQEVSHSGKAIVIASM